MRPLPLVIAHSGCMGSPENSREHLERAIAAGADLAELDLRLTGDGRVVCSHNPEIPAPGGQTLAIADFEARELAEAARELGGELLDLETAFGLIAGSPCLLNLDAKEPEAAIAAAQLARRLDLSDSILFSGLHEADARRVKGALHGTRYLLNADLILPRSGYGAREIRAACGIAEELGCCGINLDWRAATEALMGWTRARCVPVLLWTADEETDMRAALSLGPFSLTTNRPDRLVRLVEAAGELWRKQ